jgi:hypothetical protein
MCLESGSNPYQLVAEESLNVEKPQHFPLEVEEGLSLIFGLPTVSLSLNSLGQTQLTSTSPVCSASATTPWLVFGGTGTPFLVRFK